MNHKCQLHTIDAMSNEIGIFNFLWQRCKKMYHALKRRISFLKQAINIRQKKTAETRLSIQKETKSANFKAGDFVRIRPKKEIEATLDEWGKLKGCAFMPEMWPYCGTEQKIFKEVNKFMDERDYLIKKTTGIFLLENVICQGVKDFGGCDRSCFFFWRKEWLEEL